MPSTNVPRRSLRILLAKPRGFCAGVERAIETVERALERYGAPVYVRHEIVHNKRVVEKLRAKGARFVAEVDEVPEGAVTVFSAHGVTRRVEQRAAGRRLEVIDATCPLVRKVHVEGRRYADKGFEVVLIGHAGRQSAVRSLAEQVDVVLVVGARNSSNSNRLREIGEACGTPAYLVEDATGLDPRWLDGATSVGIAAGASAPEELVEELLARLDHLFAAEVRTLDGVEETVQFRLPDPLSEASA